MKSILQSVKKSCGVPAEYTQFDPDFIMHINTVFMILMQMGVGPEKGFRIEDESAVWEDFITSDDVNLESVKTYMGLKVRLLFDPPSGSAHMEAIKQAIAELEWRLNFEVESK